MTSVDDRPAGLESAAGGNPRFPCIEGLRALAAVSVVVHHVAGTTGAVIGTAWGHIYAHLDVGVSVFFVLSGFLLYRPFVAAHAEGRPGPALRRYASRRVLRIFPAYWIALTATFFVLGTAAYDGLGSLPRYYLLVHIYDSAHALRGIVPAWSLATELSFYVFLPVYAVVLGKLVAGRARPLLLELAGLVLLYATGAAVHTWLVLTREGGTSSTLWLPAQLDLFALGMGLAVAHVAVGRGQRLSLLTAGGRWPGWTWALAAVPFWFAATQLDLPREFGDVPDAGAIGRQFAYGLVAFLVVLPAVFGDQRRGWPRRLLRLRPVAFVGLVSYGLFLWHFPLLRYLDEHGALEWLPEARFAAALVLTLGLGLVVATASWFLVEAPLVRGRKAARA